MPNKAPRFTAVSMPTYPSTSHHTLSACGAPRQRKTHSFVRRSAVQPRIAIAKKRAYRRPKLTAGGTSDDFSLGAEYGLSDFGGSDKAAVERFKALDPSRECRARPAALDLVLLSTLDAKRRVWNSV